MIAQQRAKNDSSETISCRLLLRNAIIVLPGAFCVWIKAPRNDFSTELT